MCVDFRKLNAITKDDVFSLPSIEDLLAKIKKKKILFYFRYERCLPSNSCRRGDREKKTAFIFIYDLYEYDYLPFKFKNAPAHFSRVMISVLAELIGNSVLMYVYDIIVLGDTLEEHIGNLLKVLEAFLRHGIKLKIEKCQFFNEKLYFWVIR